jgi:hypothetical protein
MHLGDRERDGIKEGGRAACLDSIDRLEQLICVEGKRQDELRPSLESRERLFVELTGPADKLNHRLFHQANTRSHAAACVENDSN